MVAFEVRRDLNSMMRSLLEAKNSIMDLAKMRV
jgi:hypothetical protein